jgi:PadR family transcriptional regulator, regulatory protein PadR
MPRTWACTRPHRPRHRRPQSLRRRSIDGRCLSDYYLPVTDIVDRTFERELKKGSAELLLLSIIGEHPRHGYEMAKLIGSRSGGRLQFHLDSLYPLLYRLEERGWIQGAWSERAGERRRRVYSLTAEGRRVLTRQRKAWDSFVDAVRRIAGARHA